MDLYPLIRLRYGLDEVRPCGLYTEKTPSLQRQDTGVTSLHNYISVSVVGDELSWRVDLPEDVESHTSVVSSTQSRSVEKYNEYKLRHELVAEAFSSNRTDVRLSDTFGTMGDSFDNLTPDFAMTDQIGIVHIIELGTTRSQRREVWHKEYNGKLFSYSGPLASRATNRVVTYTPVIVTQSTVISGVELPQEMVNDLCVRMMIACAIEDQAKEMSFDITRGEEMKQVDKTADSILQVMKSIGSKVYNQDNNVIGVDDNFRELCLGSADEDRLMRDYIECRKVIAKKPTSSDHRVESAKYIGALRAGDRKYFQKAITVMPYMILKESTRSKYIYKATCTGEAPEYMLKLWDSALSQASNSACKEGDSVDHLLREAYCENKQEIEGFEKERLATRGKMKVVNMKDVLSDRVVKHLQRDGLYGKSAKNDPSNKVRRDFQKKPFHFDTDLSDIDDFIEDASGLELLNSVPTCQRAPINLVQVAHDMVGNKTFDLSLMERWMKTKHFHAFDLMSDICNELCLSLKQNHKTSEMIVKKLKHFDVYLLIKTTNSTSHVFYSIYVPDGTSIIDKKGLPFRGLLRASSGYMTEFASIKRDKMANYLNASTRFLTLASFWCDFYGISSLSVEEFSKNQEAVRMLNISMLVSLENKSETEESITQSRYMYMEIFLSVQSRMKPNPMKILPKMTTAPRSRLNLWMIKKIVNGFSLMCTNRPVRKTEEMVEGEEEDVMPGDKWRFLINFFTGNTVGSATAVVNLMYLGYLKDKNQEPEGNSEWALVEKIIEEECKIRHDQRNAQRGDLEEGEIPKGKGFSRNAIIHGCEIMEGKLKTTLGPNWKTIIHREISLALARHLTHEISTLKATSNIDHSSVKNDATVEDQGNVRRVKVIEAMAMRLGRYGLNPFLNFKTILEDVENISGGVICDLFKKQQHGGNREIYVLTSDSRILQLFIETISRVLCSYFEEETLTHPENKLKKLDEHKLNSCRIARKRSSVFADFCSSSDKTRWNQNFVMTAMIIPLIRMTVPELHWPIMRVMNLWANKFIKLPPVVLKLLMGKEKLSSETYDKLYGKFHGLLKVKEVDQRLVARPKSAFMNLTSGMMQGILHYTSSLLHVSFLNSSKRLTLSYLRGVHKKDGLKFTMTSVCSSDDSATVLSVFSDKAATDFTRLDVKAFLDCDVSLNVLTVFCQLYCMVESVKSTIALYDYVEFNSEFIFKNTVAMPVIKFVGACLTISESESFARRQYEMYNLISSLSSSGFPFLNTYMCQVAQALLHYKTMGASTSPLFQTLAEGLTRFPDFAHGFFLLDRDILTGVAGLSYSRWKSLQSSEILRAATTLHFDQDSEVAQDGTLMDSLTVMHGEHTRWYKLLDRIVEGRILPHRNSLTQGRSNAERIVNKELMQERMDMINEEPDVLYRHPNDLKELRLKLLAKALNPGVSRSLQKGNPTTVAFASSAYTLYAHCFTRVSTHQQLSDTRKESKEKKTTKVSLLQSLKQREEYSSDVLEKNLKLQDLETVFPLHHSYEEIEAVCEQFSNHTFVATHEMRQKKAFLRMQPRTDKLPVSLLQSVGNKWFDFNLKVSGSVAKRCWDAYSERFRWLRDTPGETLSASPFQRHSDLHGFISAQSSSTRTYLHVGPAVKSERFSHQIYQLIRKCSVRRYLLEPTAPGAAGKKMTELEFSGSLLRESFEAELSLALHVPIKARRDELVNDCLKKIAELRPRVEDWASLPRWEFEVGMIALFSRNMISDTVLSDALTTKHSGIRITFTKPQEKLEVGEGNYRWVGDGECVVVAEGIPMRVTLKDDEATMIRCTMVERLRLRPDLVVDTLRRLNSRPTNNLYSMTRDRLEFKFNGTQFVPPTSPGLPICRESDGWYVTQDLQSLGMQIFPGSVAIVSGVQRPLPVIKFVSKPWACSARTTTSDPVDDVWEAWVSQRPVKAATAMDFIMAQERSMGGKSRLEAARLEAVLGWLSESLQNRLKTKGIGLTNINLIDTVITTEADPVMTDKDFEELMAGLAEESVDIESMMAGYEGEIIGSVEDQLLEEYVGEVPPEWQNIKFDDLLNYSSKYSPYRAVLSNWMEEDIDFHKSVLSRESQNYYALHPLWDDFISTILSSVEAKWFSKILSGVMPVYESELAGILMKVLRIKVSRTETSLMHRLLRSTPAGSSPDDVEEPEEEGEEGPTADFWWDAEPGNL